MSHIRSWQCRLSVKNGTSSLSQFAFRLSDMNPFECIHVARFLTAWFSSAQAVVTPASLSWARPEPVPALWLRSDGSENIIFVEEYSSDRLDRFREKENVSRIKRCCVTPELLQFFCTDVSANAINK